MSDKMPPQTSPLLLVLLRERRRHRADDLLVDGLHARDDVVVLLKPERDEMVQPQDARSVRHVLVEQHGDILTPGLVLKDGAEVLLTVEFLEQFLLGGDDFLRGIEVDDLPYSCV